MDGSTSNVVSRWFDLCHRAGVGLGAASEMGQTVVDAYGEAHRRYHTLVHIEHCLHLLDDVPLDETERTDAEFAVWFHDVVYDPTRSDNEARSAAMAAAWLADQGVDGVAVEHLIEMTASHEVDAAAPLPNRAVHDVDLAVLGGPVEDYDAYRAGIRAEYRHVDDASFAVGRADVLRQLLMTEPLYSLPAFQVAFGPQALANMSRELESLSKES